MKWQNATHAIEIVRMHFFVEKFLHWDMNCPHKQPYYMILHDCGVGDGLRDFIQVF